MNVLLISLQRDLDTLGLKYLHYRLLKNDHTSFLLCLTNFNKIDENGLELIRKFVLELNPALIGVSLMSLDYLYARDLTKYLKKYFKSIPIIWGGIHPTISPEMCLHYADYVCVGEGERTILDLANAIEKKESITAINNLCYLGDGQIKRNPLYPPIKDLDEMSVGDHIPANSFVLDENMQIVPIDKNILKKYGRFRGVIYNIISSIGCPFSCTYCCNNFISRIYPSNKIRRRSVENVISELEKAVKDNPEIEYISFHDDCFLACSKEYLEEFCETYKERIGKSFIVRTLPIYVTPYKIRYLKNAGLGWIQLGLQSGSDRVCRDIYKRKSLSADFLKAAKIIKEYDLAPIYDVILDNPFEREEDKLETIKTLIETPKPFYPQLLSLVFYFGTELYERAKKDCPEKIEDPFKKDMTVYHKDVMNNLIRLSGILDGRYMNKLIRLYEQNPKGFRFKVNLFIANLSSSILFEPLTYFQVIRLSQRGSYIKTLKVLPIYFEEGFRRHLNRFGGKVSDSAFIVEVQSRIMGHSRIIPKQGKHPVKQLK